MEHSEDFYENTIILEEETMKFNDKMKSVLREAPADITDIIDVLNTNESKDTMKVNSIGISDIPT